MKITSKDIPGTPRAHFAVLAALLQDFELPLSVLIGIDAFFDPIRTSFNAISHCTAPGVVARWEGTSFVKPPIPSTPR